jgi:hypothetical protein
MARGKKHTAEQIVNLLRQVEVGGEREDIAASVQGSGDRRADVLPVAQGVRRVKVDQARRLKELEQENAKLKRLVSELSLEKLVLKDIASGNF